MQVTAWKNGVHSKTGTSYGLTVHKSDRDDYFNRSWSVVYLELPGIARPLEVNIGKGSFWKKCPHLINTKIREWLSEHEYIPWERGQPPKFQLEQVGERRFKLSTM